jgi:hypothetical protein
MLWQIISATLRLGPGGRTVIQTPQPAIRVKGKETTTA